MNDYIDPKNSLEMFGLTDKFNFLKNLYISKKMPKILMLSGNKGIGKFTLINHFLSYVFDGNNYDLNNKTINDKTNFYKQYLNNIFSNIIYLSGNDFKNIKVEDIRNLKSKILKTSFNSQKRFIILDDIELFNVSSLNALLKIIEEPSSNDHFILINNKTKSLIETIYSRSLEFKILLNNESRLKIIQSLIKKFNLKVVIDFEMIYLTPGNFLIFNDICLNNKINIEDNFLQNLQVLLNLYKKKKDINLINMILFLTDYYFKNIKENNNSEIENIIENKLFVLSNINKFVTYNLNQNSLINSINNRLHNE
tara:strand:+ start:3660 stop:4589 length:930 start_codon:yes stop_codon:yes gene_type:complete